jgi:hypothetical protein
MLYSTFCFSQNIFLTEIKATNNNKDKFLYALQKQPDSAAQYLGKIEVSGYSTHDVEMFSEIYKKAKSIGSNTYILKSPENIDGVSEFNPSHYEIYLYYIEGAKIPKQENNVYLLNPDKEIQIRMNDHYKKLEPRSYIKYNLDQKDITDISVGKFLGSRVKFQNKEGQADQYFLVSGKRITSNSPVNPGINFKTGDLIKLEKSYALFLISIYQEK